MATDRSCPHSGINNCGLATLALFSQGGGTFDPIELGKLQATQVSVISLWNCAGRIIFGEQLLRAYCRLP